MSSENGMPGADSASVPAKDADAMRRKAQATGSALRDQAADMAEDLKGQAKGLTEAASEKAEDVADQSRKAGAAQVEGLAGAVRHVADDLEATLPGVARHVRAAADSVDGIAESLRGRNVGELLGEVTDFARRQPVAFFGAAVLAGFAVSRFAKSSAVAESNAPVNKGAAFAGQAPGWAPGPDGQPARPMTTAAASLGGAVAHRPGDAAPGSMPVIKEARP